MLSVDNLCQVAEDLQKRGIDAVYGFLYGAHGCIEGLIVADEFFPLWELSQSENLEAVERADFTAILQRRAVDWTAEPPRLARSVR